MLLEGGQVMIQIEDLLDYDSNFGRSKIVVTRDNSVLSWMEDRKLFQFGGVLSR